MSVLPDFTGTLSFSVAGPGVSIDPASGAVSVATDRLAEGIEIAVVATDAAGAVAGRFRLVFQAVEAAEAPTLPQLVAEPALAGPAVVGTAVGVDAGTWEGAEGLGLEWRLDGAAIAGATGASYLPVAADDGRDLSCRVIATNAAGTAEAETAAARIVHAAPRVTGTLADLALEVGDAAVTVDAAAAFAGADLGYSVAGAGATIDARSGAVSVPATLVVAGATVTVTATNSGGSASVTFGVTVTAAPDVTPVVPPVAAPEAVGRIADVRFPQDGATHSVSTQAHFAGSDLVFALVAAPAGVTIMAGSGLVEVQATAALEGATVTVRATNAGGSATQSFALTVGGSAGAGVAAETVFDASAALADVRFIHEGAAPDWGMAGRLQARLALAAEGRVHADWTRAGGDGLYRALVRWNAGNTGKNGSSPFVFGARIARSGADFSGVYAEVTRISGVERQLRLLEYTGAGTETRLLAATTSPWVWYTWYWFEMEIVGTAVKARLHAPDAAAPAWQVEAVTSRTAGGLFGPSGFPIGGVGPVVDVQRLEFVPASVAAPVPPAAAADGDWDLTEITERK